MIVRMISYTITQRVLDPAYFENVADNLSIGKNGEAKRCSAVCRFEVNGVKVEGTFYLSAEVQESIEALLAAHIEAQNPVS